MTTFNIWYGASENPQLSNLAYRPFKDATGYRFITVEQGYQTLKSGNFDPDTFMKPWRAGAKFPGKPALTKDDWNIRLMERLIWESFSQNSDAAKALLATGQAILTHRQDPGIWRHTFPRLLMTVREKLAAQ